MNIYLAIFLMPLISVAFIMIDKNNKAVKWSLFFIILQSFLICFLLNDWNIEEQNYFSYSTSLINSFGLSINIKINHLNFLLTILTNLISLCGILMSWKITRLQKLYFSLIWLLNFSAIGFFTNSNLLVMFLFLELAVVPKFLLIYIWGTGKNKYYSLKLLISLMLGTILLVLGIFILLHQVKNIPNASLDIYYLKTVYFPWYLKKIVFILLFMGFGVYASLFPFHFWVPGAHSSAPTVGSMFLAGLSLKLGSFGCLVTAMILFPDVAQYYQAFIVGLAIVSIVYGAILTCLQQDIKLLNAYSSISHCGFIILGLFLFNSNGYIGSVLQMFSHGLMATLMFAIIGMIYYRTQTKQLKRMSGLLKSFPFIASAFILAGLGTIGFPGYSSFIAELLILLGCWDNGNNFFQIISLIALSSLLISAFYILKLWKKTSFGEILNKYKNIADAFWYEKLVVFILLFITLFVGFWPKIFVEFLSFDGINF